MRGLAGKRALITGGTSGIGLAIARRLADEGCRTVVSGRDRTRGEAAATALGGGFAAGDVSDDGEHRRVVDDAVAQLGGLDLAILNAGVIEDVPLSATTDDVWDAVLATNLTAVLVGAQLCLPHLRAAGGGAIVITSSDAGVWGELEIGAYSISKRAGLMLAQVLSVEAGEAGIRVNAVCPGDTEPGMRTSVSGRGEVTSEGWHTPPIGRLGRAADIAGAVAYLCSDDAAFVTGTSLLVDGGMRATLTAWSARA